MTVFWTFLTSPLGRRIALIGGLVLGLSLLWIWHERDAARALREAHEHGYQAGRAEMVAKLQEAETAARDTIRRKEAAAYQRAVEDERARAAADAADAEQAATIVERVIKVSPSARDCTVDQATAEALNELRGSGE